MEVNKVPKIRVFQVFEADSDEDPVPIEGEYDGILYIPSEPPGLPDQYAVSDIESRDRLHLSLCRTMVKLHQYSYQNRRKVNYYWRRRYPIAEVISRYEFDPWVRVDEWRCNNLCRGKTNLRTSLWYDEACGECFADVSKSVYSWSGIEDWDLETVDETTFTVLARFMIRAKSNWRHAAAWLYWNGDDYRCYVYALKQVYVEEMLKTVEKVLTKLGISKPR